MGAHMTISIEIHDLVLRFLVLVLFDLETNLYSLHSIIVMNQATSSRVAIFEFISSR